MSWERNGIEGRGEFPPTLINRFQGKAMILGSGRSIWDDLKRFNPPGTSIPRKSTPFGVVAVNDMILHYKGPVHHAVSLHPEQPYLWLQLRKYRDLDCNLITHSQYTTNPKYTTDYNWAIENGNTGTSGLFAAMLALALGYDRIVLCGMPLDNLGHFYDPPGYSDGLFQSDYIRNVWHQANHHYFQGRVKSLSGFTRNLLGEPDESWLHS